jgi:NADPH2:quinone reductase
MCPGSSNGDHCSVRAEETYPKATNFNLLKYVLIQQPMKAIQVSRFGEPAVMQLETVAPPALQDDHQVIVGIRAAGVNPVDTYIRAGRYGRLPALPYTPGLDGSGEVLAVGAAVETCQVGDRVYGGWPTTGTYAEQTLYSSQWVFPLPAGVSFEQGAGIFVPYSTAYRALFHKGMAQPGDTVLVHGATGAVGLAAVQLAVAAGMTVIGTGGSPAGRELAQAQGAALVVDHHREEYRQDILDATSGQGVDVILEMLADVNLAHDLILAAPGGRVVIIGSRGTVDINPREIMGRETTVTGMSLFNTPPETMQQIQCYLQAGLKNGSLVPLLRQTLPMAAASEAHEAVMSSAAQGNWVLLP